MNDKNSSLAFGYALTKRLPLLAILTILLCGMVQEGYGQTRTYLTGQKTGRTESTILVSTANLSTPMSSPTLFTPFYFADIDKLVEHTIEPVKIQITSLLDLAGLLNASAYIQFRNTANSSISERTTTYITLNEPPNLSGLLNVPLSEQEFIIGKGYSNSDDYKLGELLDPAAENTGTEIANTVTELLIDDEEKWYAGITPSSDYNSVRLTLKTGNALLSVGDVFSVNVYNAFTQTEGNECSIFGKFTTPGEVTGISVNLLNLSEAISDAHHVLLDNDEYAAYSSGILGVGVANSISQTIVYDHKASSTDGLNVKLALSNNLIGLDVLNAEAISISAYDGPGGNAVWEKDLIEIAQLLDLDLLNLINLGGTHGMLEFTVHPNKQFDRIQIQFTPSVINVGVLNDALRVYHVKLAPAPPTITDQPEDQEICAGETVTFSVSANSPAGTITGYQWQYYDGTNWVPAPGTYENASYTISNTDQSLNGRLYRVAITGGHFGCEQTIYSESAELSVTPLPGRATVNFLETNN